jgi:hypothetical protein
MDEGEVMRWLLGGHVLGRRRLLRKDIEKERLSQNST